MEERFLFVSLNQYRKQLLIFLMRKFPQISYFFPKTIAFQRFESDKEVTLLKFLRIAARGRLE